MSSIILLYLSSRVLSLVRGHVQMIVTDNFPCDAECVADIGPVLGFRTVNSFWHPCSILVYSLALASARTMHVHMRVDPCGAEQRVD